jgi:FKBP-type peptidyl-prolyl cis-trans isomerase FkpA
MPYGILVLALLGLTPAVIILATRLRSLLTVPVRIALAVAMLMTAAACGGGDSSPSNTPTPPSAPYSATDLREGTGATASQGRTVTVSYTGWLYDPGKPESKGAQFDSSANFSFQLGVGRVIAGWDQGVLGMKVGGQRRLVIPPNLGYGSQMVGSIPPNSTLVFDVMLLNVS